MQARQDAPHQPQLALDLQLDRLASLPDVRLEIDTRTREQFVSALLGLTETEIENALAKAAIVRRGLDQGDRSSPGARVPGWGAPRA
jgi:hypothetical protein